MWLGFVPTTEIHAKITPTDGNCIFYLIAPTGRDSRAQGASALGRIAGKNRKPQRGEIPRSIPKSMVNRFYLVELKTTFRIHQAPIRGNGRTGMGALPGDGRWGRGWRPAVRRRNCLHSSPPCERGGGIQVDRRKTPPPVQGGIEGGAFVDTGSGVFAFDRLQPNELNFETLWMFCS